MANLHAFVTNTISKCLKILKVLISLDCFKIFRVQPIKKHNRKIYGNGRLQWTATLLQGPSTETEQSTNFKSSRASTNINISKHRQSSTWRKKMIVYKHCMQTAPQHEAGQCLAIASHSASRSPLAKGSPEQQPQKRKSRLNS